MLPHFVALLVVLEAQEVLLQSQPVAPHNLLPLMVVAVVAVDIYPVQVVQVEIQRMHLARQLQVALQFQLKLVVQQLPMDVTPQVVVQVLPEMVHLLQTMEYLQMAQQVGRELL